MSLRYFTNLYVTLQILCIWICIGCKEEQAKTDQPPAPAIQQLAAYGCSASDNGDGSVHISCADGSKGDVKKGDKGDSVTGMPGAPGYFNPKEATGTVHTNLIHISHDGNFHWLSNKTSGNIVGYDSTGHLMSVNTLYFPTLDCSGPGYMSLSGAAVYFGNTIVRNSASWGSSNGFKVGPTMSGSNSVWTGSCSTAGAHPGTFYQAIPANLDSTDLTSMSVPITLIAGG